MDSLHPIFAQLEILDRQISTLNTSNTKLVTQGDKSFSHAPSTVWNSLPIPIELRKATSITIFKSKLFISRRHFLTRFL